MSSSSLIDTATEALHSIGPTAKTVLWSVFGLVVLVYLVVSFVLLYHWRRYGMQNKKVVFAELVYFVVSLAILAVAAFSVIFI